jgi:hypothetical protein
MHMLEHAAHLELQPEQHSPDPATVPIDLTDDLFLRSLSGARWELGIPLPVEW